MIMVGKILPLLAFLLVLSVNLYTHVILLPSTTSTTSFGYSVPYKSLPDVPLCTSNPYISSLNASLPTIASRADAWLRNVDKHMSRATSENDPTLRNHTHARFFPLQEMTDSCIPTCVGGRCFRDESKSVCGLQQLNDMPNNKNQCIIYSIGGNNQWSFELDLLQQTTCQVHTFDCTGSIERFKIPPHPRLYFHHVCLGDVSRPVTSCDDAGVDSSSLCGPVMTLADMQTMLGHTRLDLLKMDVEGYEFPVLNSWPLLGGASRDRHDPVNHRARTTNDVPILPMQLLLEIHYRTQFCDLASTMFGKQQNCSDYERHGDWEIMQARDFVKLEERLLRMGYVVALRDDNTMCLHCTEVTLVRYRC